MLRYYLCSTRDSVHIDLYPDTTTIHDMITCAGIHEFTKITLACP